MSWEVRLFLGTTGLILFTWLAVAHKNLGTNWASIAVHLVFLMVFVHNWCYYAVAWPPHPNDEGVATKAAKEYTGRKREAPMYEQSQESPHGVLSFIVFLSGAAIMIGIALITSPCYPQSREFLREINPFQKKGTAHE
jgi:hypothetical protein